MYEIFSGGSPHSNSIVTLASHSSNNFPIYAATITLPLPLQSRTTTDAYDADAKRSTNDADAPRPTNDADARWATDDADAQWATNDANAQRCTYDANAQRSTHDADAQRASYDASYAAYAWDASTNASSNVITYERRQNANDGHASLLQKGR